MKPTMDHVLIQMATRLGEKVIPDMPETSYARGDASMIAGVAILLAQEVDRAADTLVRENAALRSLFAKAATADVGAMADAFAKASVSADANLRVSTLEAGNAALKELLIPLHALVEESDADWARALNADIWAILRRGAEDRMLILPSM